MSTRSRSNRRAEQKRRKRGARLRQLHAELRAADTEEQRKHLSGEVRRLLTGEVST